MLKKPLEILFNELESELIRLGYTQGSLKFYKSRWRMLNEFALKNNQIYFSEQLGIDFLENKFQIFEKQTTNSLSQKDVQELRVIRMIGDFQLHHTVLRRYYKHKKILFDKYFIEVSLNFKKYCLSKNYSKVTINHYVKQSEKFMDFLIAQGIDHCNKVTLLLINAYIKTLLGYSYKTVEQVICSLRAFLRFLLLENIIDEDLATKTPMIQARKQKNIPSVWTKEELKKLIAAIDKGSPKGKRDYAIILLACRLGLRVKDIKELKFENLNWSENKLSFIQSKTHTPLTLPLTPEVGWAIIDYVKNGRPKVDTSIIFVRHVAPFLPFAASNHLTSMIKRYMQLAHIPISKKARGMHSLRHSAASMMLESNVPLSTISNILGHSTTDSTAVYLKVDIEKLRECSLEFVEVSNE